MTGKRVVIMNATVTKCYTGEQIRFTRRLYAIFRHLLCIWMKRLSSLSMLSYLYKHFEALYHFI